MPQYSGIWTEQAVMQAVGAGNWANVPGVPTGVTGTVLGATSVSVAFTAPTFAGIPATITSYTVTSSPGGITASGASSPITVTGLTTGTPYTFTVTATNASGTSSPSAASSSVTPVQIDYIEDVFSTYLYTGNGSARSITNNIDLSTYGGLVWIKDRVATPPHLLIDTARGGNKFVSSNTTFAQTTESIISAFNTTGFSLTADTTVGDWNWNGDTYASWTFRKQPKFFDVVTWTGNGANYRAISHSLGSTPGCVIVKSTSASGAWAVWHRSTDPNNLILNSTSAAISGQYSIQDVGSTSFAVASSSFYGFPQSIPVNDNSATYVAYLFAHNAGGFGLTGSDNVISCGSLVSGTVQDINLGYEPQWIMYKNVSGTTGGWTMFDIMRGMTADGSGAYLQANTSAAEATASAQPSPLATGFRWNYTGNSGQTFIYIAIRRGPMKVPTSGTSVYNSAAGAAGGITTGIVTDMGFIGQRSGTDKYYWGSRLTSYFYLNSVNTNAQDGSQAGALTWDRMNGFWNNDLTTYQGWGFQRAPSFFDEVCYTGNGTSGATQNHNLGVVPELVILKCRSAVQEWRVMCAYYNGGSSPWSYRTALNTTGGISAGSGVFNDTAPTASVFTLGDNAEVNDNGSTYVAYLFATCTGVSKVGSYTGTGALLTVNCGFAAGARFVLIKRTDSTGDWYTYDSARGISSSSDPYLLLNSTAAEVTGTNYVDTTSVGFQVTAAAPAGLNASGGTYIFLAIA